MGPKPGEGIDIVTAVTILDNLKAVVTFQRPEAAIFSHHHSQRPVVANGNLWSDWKERKYKSR